MNSQDLVHMVIKIKDLIHIQNKKNVLSQKKKKKKNVKHIKWNKYDLLTFLFIEIWGAE